jgi:uncharacterized hydrophobic protein (TIGR00271 family)
MLRFLYRLFSLHEDEDNKELTLQRVRNNISFTGANFWILACAILIASVGLNVNSTAVIIGAMLISPLMGPIVASGFALGTYDFELLKKALKNLLIATIASLLVSATYFFISPFKDVHSELLARTSPNIFDIFIAFFGGLVGVIAVTRVEKGNPIPGVAIATALMPPLCTAGYGLGTGQFEFFFGAFFLYCINCVFICIATYAIVKYLKYPALQKVNASHQRQIRYGITTLISIMLLPSIYFAYLLYKQQQYVQAVNNFINQEFVENGNTVVYRRTDLKKEPHVLELAFLYRRFSQPEIERLNGKLSNYGIYNTKLIIKQDSIDNVQMLRSSILNEIENKENTLDINAVRIKFLESQIAKNTYDNVQILKEANAIFPSIKTLSLSNHSFSNNDSISKLPVLIYQSKRELTKSDKRKFKNWLKQRLKIDSLIILKN